MAPRDAPSQGAGAAQPQAPTSEYAHNGCKSEELPFPGAPHCLHRDKAALDMASPGEHSMVAGDKDAFQSCAAPFLLALLKQDAGSKASQFMFFFHPCKLSFKDCQ